VLPFPDKWSLEWRQQLWLWGMGKVPYLRAKLPEKTRSPKLHHRRLHNFKLVRHLLNVQFIRKATENNINSHAQDTTALQLRVFLTTTSSTAHKHLTFWPTSLRPSVKVKLCSSVDNSTFAKNQKHATFMIKSISINRLSSIRVIKGVSLRGVYDEA
jgi:hypothetical protein